MSRSLGNELPEALLALLDGQDLGARADLVLLLTTVDPRGYPHPAMLSVGEVLAPDPRTLRLALYRNSATSNHLRRAGAFSIALAHGGLGYYVKATAREVAERPAELARLAVFEAPVDEVLEDGDPIAEVTSGFTIRLTADRDRILAHWERQVAGLRALS